MKYKISDVFDLQMGKTPDRNKTEYWNDGTEPWISIADMSKADIYIGNTKECISNLAVEKSGIKIIPGNTVIMSFKLSIGKVAITERDMYSNEAIMAFIDKEVVRVIPEYLYYSLLSKDWNEGTNKAVMGKTLNKATLSQMKIVIHGYDEQKMITDKLHRLGDVIAQRRKQLELLDTLIKARFVEMFGDPVTNPYGYKKKALKETCKVITGNTPSRDVVEYYGDYIEWIKTDNIVSGLTNPTSAAEYLSEKGMRVGRYVDEGAILMACIAGSIASIGRVCITNRRVAFNQQINAIIPAEYNVCFLYTLLILSKEYLVEEINMALKGILSKSKLEGKTFYVPPMEKQNAFADFITEVDKSKAVVQKALDEAQLLFDSLMQQYFG